MKTHSNLTAASFDTKGITATIQRALASAGLDTTSGPMRNVTETIERALAAGRAAGAMPAPHDDVSVIDVATRVVGDGDGDERVVEPHSDAAIAEPAAGGRFARHEFSNHAGTRAYKLYMPAEHADADADAAMPMVVMLHGCTQSPDDFAAGTQMNRLAEEHGFLVVYPEQAAHANASKCWNWFKAQDQSRDSGEPALIAGIVREVAARHRVDPRRIFVAGLSAGAAMAVILGETYPELFAGVGAHSGLPYASAHDIASAMAAMKGGRSGMAGLKDLGGAAAGPRRKAAHAVPTIVFHGDRDHTVQQSNAAEIVLQASDAHRAEAGGSGLRTSTQAGRAPGGLNYSRTVHVDAGGQIRMESWLLHGAGHAWSGGHASGSYTDATGPDASAEMVRFFLGRPRAGSA